MATDNGKIAYVGTTEASLTETQRKTLERLVKNAPDMLGLECYSNVDCAGRDVPSGIAMYFPPDAHVDPGLVGNDMFRVTCVTPVAGVCTDEQFANGLERLSSVIDQHPEDGADADVRHPEHTQDVKHWTPELGGDGSFVGAYFSFQPDHRTKDYYLVANTSIPRYATQLRDELKRTPGVTYGDLVDPSTTWQSRVRHGNSLALRNAERSLAVAANAFNAHVAHQTDLPSYTEHPDHAKPMRAISAWAQPSASIVRTTYRGQPAVGLVYGLVNARNASSAVGKKVFVATGPYEGLHAFKLETTGRAAWIPANTGRNALAASSTTTDLSKRATSFVWDSKSSQRVPFHPDLTHDAHHTITPALAAHLKTAGWNAEVQASVLVPLATKLYEKK